MYEIYSQSYEFVYLLFNLCSINLLLLPKYVHNNEDHCLNNLLCSQHSALQIYCKIFSLNLKKIDHKLYKILREMIEYSMCKSYIFCSRRQPTWINSLLKITWPDQGVSEDPKHATRSSVCPSLCLDVNYSYLVSNETARM